MKKRCLLICFSLLAAHVFGQTSDDAFRKPLKEVLTEIQSTYGVAIRYPEDLVKDKWVMYAQWRYRPELEKTLSNILASQDLTFAKEGEKKYKLQGFQYHLKTVEEGKEQLAYLSSLYNDAQSWERRRDSLRSCMLAALRLQRLPQSPGTKPVITAVRKFSDYTVQNIAIETLPGVYVSGSLYRPLKAKDKLPVVLNPDGHFSKGRYREDCQYRCAVQAKMGAIAFSYDLFGWDGESLLQIDVKDHRRSLVQNIQVLNTMRILDYLLSLKDADTSRVAITGASGGGSQTMLMTALDNRIKLSVPVAMLSSYHSGGCPCESGAGVHLCGGGTNNVEIAAMAAPRPQLVISDGKDWTQHVPENELPFLKRTYSFYGKEGQVQNVHLPTEGHDYGPGKRMAMYEFLAQQFRLKVPRNSQGEVDESGVVIEPEAALKVFGEKGENLPANAVKGFDGVINVFNDAVAATANTSVYDFGTQRYKVAVVDLMILKRQKLGAFGLTKEIGADGVEVDMGGLGNRPTFDNTLANDSVRRLFLSKAKELNLEIPSLAMSGYYAQSFCQRGEFIRSIKDCIATMKAMNVKVAFLPLGVQCDLVKKPELRDSVIGRLKVAGNLAEEAGVVIGIETALDAKEELRLLTAVASPSIKSYFNFSNALKNGRDVSSELKILGKDNIVQIHCTDDDGVWLQNNTRLDMKKVKQTLDAMGWRGWLVIERSRDAKEPTNVKKEFQCQYSVCKIHFSGTCCGKMKTTKTLLLLLFFPSLAWSQIYVSVNGSDTADGTKEKPFASAAMALRKAREMRRLKDPLIRTGVRIVVAGGVYRFEEPLLVRPEDAGTKENPTTIEAAVGEKPVFSGGIGIKGWVKVSGVVANLPKQAQGKLWVANVPLVGDNILNFRQLWVNGKKAIRARDRNDDTMSRILSWNKKDQSCWIPKPGVGIQKLQGLEMVIHQWWAIANLRIKSVEVKGDSALLRFHQPESRIQSEHPWPAPWLSSETGNSAFYLANAITFLDSPGEWYLDKQSRKLYYWPRRAEDLQTATVVAPVLETLIIIQGTLDRPVTNVHFKGISFEHTTWLRPAQYGHVPLQTGMYLLDAYKLKPAGTPEKASLENQAWVGRPAAAVAASYANETSFRDCRFEHLASTGLDFHRGVQNSTINGNLFKDVGGTAVLAGVFSDEATEAHQPYNPSDKREVCSGIAISNNLITDVTNEDWGCVGIGAGFVKNTSIEHNDITDVAYTGISLGWGWTALPNVMQNNRVVANKIMRYGRQLYDVAAIYTLSAQPGTVISNNYIDSIYKAPYAHIPSHWFYLYTDEGTSGITVKNNWTPSEKFLQNANGPGNTWEQNGPMVSADVTQQAGVTPPFYHLLNERLPHNKSRIINKERPVIIELVSGRNKILDIAKLRSVLGENGIHTDAVYQWQNHTVIFEKVQDAFVLKSKLQKAFPDALANVYYDAFYDFNRQNCPDTASVNEREHILLTADLVADATLQQEYLAYHAAQAESWPEVARGFCNAGFQQLLLYKNGKRLMLVISIPKGESLDKLNPKTTENNPRMNEWNNRMRKYQQGIEGTKPGEVWVFLKKVEGSKK